MIKKSNLYLFTFLSIFLTLFITGAVLSPLFLNMVRSTYIQMNTSINQDQADVVARMIGRLLAQGESKASVIASLQSSLDKTDMDRTFLCLIDTNTDIFLAHPLKTIVGKNAIQFMQSYSKASHKTAFAKNEALNSGVILKLDWRRTEIINSSPVPNTSLMVYSHIDIVKLNTDIALFQKGIIIIFMLLGFIIAFPASFAAFKVSRQYEKEIEAEQEKSEKLLLNILPPSIAKRLKAEERNIANRYEDVSVLFIDMVNFTPLATKMSPEKLVELLNHIFSQFDAILRKFGLEKIKTIGDAYMAAGGIPEPKEDHLSYCIAAALEMIAFIKEEYSSENKIQVRMGLHTGPVVAGVIGHYKFTYDLWGETVNTASRLESTSLPGFIHCSETVYERMKDTYSFTPQGKVLLKGMGEVSTWFLG